MKKHKSTCKHETADVREDDGHVFVLWIFICGDETSPSLRTTD